MRDPDKIDHLRSAVERNIEAVRARPSSGQGTALTRVRIRDGCTAEVEDGGWKLLVDESTGDGGGGAGPDPGVYGRAGLGGCVAMGYAMWAARLGVRLDSIEVDVEADYDARGMLGLDDSIPPGWLGMRYHVRIESAAPEADIMDLLDYADAHSSLLDCFTRALPVRREVQISAPAR
jgi:uncharacterized OsmC-like protein